MGVREYFNQRSKLGASIALIAVAVAGYFAVVSMRPPDPVGKQFYTEDDGKSWFVDRAGLIVPFDRNGRQVVMAEVFEVKGRRFVAYMRRYTPAALKSLKEKPPTDAKAAMKSAIPPRMEYKKPGDAQWRDIEGDLKAMNEYLNLNSAEGDLTQVDP